MLLADNVGAQMAVRSRLGAEATLFSQGLLRVRNRAGIDRRMRQPLRVAPTVMRELADEAAGEDPLVRVDRLLAAGARAATLLSEVFLEATLHNAIVLFDECDVLVTGHLPLRAEQLQELERFEGVVILASNKGLASDTALHRRIAWVGRFGVPDAPARELIWRNHLDRLETVIVDPALSVAALAGRYELTGGYIRNAVTLALHRAVARQPVDPMISSDDLHSAATAQLRGDTGELTRSRAGTLGLDSLVLPNDVRDRIAELLNACRQRDRFLYELGMAQRLTTSRGIVALFSGDPGTGKTFCAELLAAELGAPLQRVHIPSVVSSYVGDTEKNISRLFDLARAEDCVLLFDEADSLFATRTKVQSATDRFANMNVNQLLQEIERHEGVVILTTNLKTSLDSALARRILFHVTFPFPEPAERGAIWEKLLPETFRDPGDPIGVDELANTFELAGGNIRNVVVRACYRALHEGRQLGRSLLMDVGMQECEAVGKIVRVKR